jgi:nitrile hydratase
VNPRFAPGQAVRVRRADPPGHVRTPWYIRGHAGVVERVVGPFPNPEERAYARSGLPAVMLYRVRFAQRQVWQDYRGPESDTLDIELYEHWLEPATSS